MALKNWDPASIIVIFSGSVLSGFADGTFVKLEFDEDAYMKQVGADGEAARVRNQNRGALLTLTLMQTSASNDVLSAAEAADRAGLGVGSLMVKDLLGRTLASAESAWVKKMSGIEFGKEFSNREWAIDIARLEMVVGGN